MTKKINKKKIMITILIILVISLSFGLGAYADYVLNATEVQYTRNGSTVSVKAALDELYNKTRFRQSNKVFNIGDIITYNNEDFIVIEESCCDDNHISAVTWSPLKQLNDGSLRQCVSR